MYKPQVKGSVNSSADLVSFVRCVKFERGYNLVCAGQKGLGHGFVLVVPLLHVQVMAYDITEEIESPLCEI